MWSYFWTHLNQITFHNLQSYLIYRHTKLWVSIRYTICENLVKKTTLQTWLVVDYVWKLSKNAAKSQLAVTSGKSIHQNVCTKIRHIFCGCLVKIRQKTFIFVIFFQTKPVLLSFPIKTISKTKNLAMLGWFWIKYDIYSKYSRPLHELV